MRKYEKCGIALRILCVQATRFSSYILGKRVWCLGVRVGRSATWGQKGREVAREAKDF